MTVGDAVKREAPPARPRRGIHSAWEYVTCGADGPSWNTLGADGWELVAVSTSKGLSGQILDEIGYFKRRIPA